MRRKVQAAVPAFVLTLAACSDAGEPTQAPVRVTPAPAGSPWETLDEWHLFSDAATQKPADRVVPYDVVSQLYADRALKHRFLHIPEGEVIRYDGDAKWEFPVGTILV